MATWIDGDIDGLRNLADTLRAYVPRVRDLAGRLSVVARNLTQDDRDGWHGSAADAFTAAWQKQARAAAALEDYVTAVAGVVGELAAELARAESAAEQAAHDPGVREQSRSRADAARDAAARRLTRLHEQVAGPKANPDGAIALLAGGALAAPPLALGRHAAGHAAGSDAGKADGSGAGKTADGLRAAEREPEELRGVLSAAEKIPMVDVGATVAGSAVGSYYDIEDGRSPVSAIPDEIISNGAGVVAADEGGRMAGLAIGTRLGAAGGPVGVAAGAVIGYGAGDLAQNLLTEHWAADIHAHGVTDGVLDGTHHAADQTADDARELAVRAGHQAEHYWDDVFGG